MDYTFEHDKTSGVCVVRASGEIKRPEDSKHLQQFARDFRADHGCTKFLVDMREATIVGSTVDTYETGVAPGQQNFERDFRIALVYSEGLDEHKFLENVVVNRGYHLRVFDDIEQARFWLVRE